MRELGQTGDALGEGDTNVCKTFQTSRSSYAGNQGITAVNVLNHPNFQSIDPFVEDAGLFSAGTGFGDPRVTDTVPGAINFPVRAGRRLIFGGTLTF